MPQPVSRYWKYLAITLAALLGLLCFAQLEVKQAVAKTFRYHLRVKVVDAATGQPLKAGVGIPGTSSTDHYPQGGDVTVEDEGVFVIDGVGYTDRIWTFSAEGHAEQSLVIGTGGPHSGEMIIRLEKASAGK